MFAINATNGVVIVQGNVDRESRPSYALVIRATDKGNPRLFTEKEFLVTVTDLDDNAPVFTAKPYEGW